MRILKLFAWIILLAITGEAGCAASGEIRFEDFTAAAGLESSLKPWRLAHSASWGDLTGKGFPDLYLGAFASQPRWQDGPIPNMLFLNAGGKRFTLSPQKELQMDGIHARPSHVLLADLDQDGDLDMMVACHASHAKEFQTTLWENHGGGQFRNVTPVKGYWPKPMGYRNVAAVDLNRDGLLDIVACDNNYSNWRDGKGSLLVLINKGGFEFEDGRERFGFPAKGTTGFGLAIGDVNDDGRFDFFVADCNRLFVSDPDGRYLEIQAGAFPKPQGKDRESRTCGAVFGDLNGDGLLDLVTTEHGEDSQVRVYMNEGMQTGAPHFRTITREAGLEGAMPDKGITGLPVKGAHVAIMDFDNDGCNDIWLSAVWRDDAGRLQPVVLRNLGNDAKGIPRFSPIPRNRLVGYYAPAPVADFDRDGRMDGFMAGWFNWDETPSILFRNVTEGGNWLTVRVKGRGKHNTMGIGVVVRTYEAGQAGNQKGFIQRCDIAVGAGYASGEEAFAHLGLGRRNEVDIEIQWGGEKRVLPRQAVNRLLTVEWGKDPLQSETNADAIMPGLLLADNPTINNLAFRWFVQGDQNVNATVRVSYRKKGTEAWNAALPMLRISRQTTVEGGFTGDLFAGSVLNLESATMYEVKFELDDPDGGQAVSNITIATRSEPAVGRTGNRQLHVYPPEYKGIRQKPVISDLQTAFNKAQPGDVVLLHAGIYAGPFIASASGTEENPIVFRAAGDGESIIDGSAQKDKSVIEIAPGSHHLYFERLTVRGGRVGIRGMQTDGLVVWRCTISDVLYGVSTGTTKGSFQCNNWYVADNTLTGRYTQWKKRTKDYFGAGINIAGRGHIACYNRVRCFWDGVSIAHIKTPVPLSWATDPAGCQNAIDIYNNDISEAVDDAIEADYGICNIRVMRNRVTDSLVGISVQPCLAGPIYVTHNVAYRFTQAPWKLYVGPTGVMLFHNTTMAGIWRSLCSANTRISNSSLRNNLFLGGREGAHVNVGDTRTSLDYNGYDTAIVYNGKSYRTPGLLAAATGQETHGRIVPTGSMINPPTFDADRDYTGVEVDLRLKTDSPAVDAGEVLDTINNGFSGKAPDLGAYEVGQLPPHYGPRTAELTPR